MRRVLLLAVPALLLPMPWLLSAYGLGVLTIGYYVAVFAMSWDLLFGFANEVNFGPTFLIGSSAYAAGILNAHGVPIPLCLAAGTLTALGSGLLLAVPALRLSGSYFGLTTLVAVLILQQLIILFAHDTGGEVGLTLRDVITIDAAANYWMALGFMGLSMLILWRLSRSSVGLILQASGQDRLGALVLGFNVAKHKIAAFAISAVFSGLAGGLLVFYLGTASVGTVVDISVAAQIIIAAILGGRRTIVGAALGAVLLILGGEALRPLGQLSTFVVSLLALLVILFRPDGLVGALSRRSGAR